MLLRTGGEDARATSIVRYAPGSAFPRHVHSGGEKIAMLDGVFQDEHGDYTAGSYFRNPRGTSHVPASEDGCVIFVRLWQLRDGDRAQVVCWPSEGEALAPQAGATRAISLFNNSRENVRLEDCTADATISVSNTRGLEFLVLSGGMTIGEEALEPQSRGRLPAGSDRKAKAGENCARIWIKDAPLLHPEVCQMPE